MKKWLVILLSFIAVAAFGQATKLDAVKLVKNGPAGYYYRANSGGTANEWASPATAREDLNYWTLNSGNVFYSGNVGVGINPAYKLHVNGKVVIGPNFQLVSDGGEAGEFATVGDFNFYTNVPVAILPSGTAKITIKKANGFVGIGTDSPSDKLTVNAGGIRATGASAGTITSDALAGTANRLVWTTATGVLGFADASVTSSSTQVNITAQGTRNMRIGAGGNTILATGTDRNLEVRDDGSIQLHGGLTADPSSPNVAAIWWNTTSTRAKYRKDGSTTVTFANLEEDIVGLADAIGTTTHTPGGTTRLVRYDAVSNAVTATLGAGMDEGQTYTFPCTRNATNAVTFSAASGYNFRESGNSTLFTTSLTAVAHTTYQAKRFGTVIYIGKI